MTAVAQPSPSGERTRRDDRDPLGRVLVLGGSAAISGTLLGVAGAVALHAALAVRVVTALIDLGDFAENTHAYVIAARLDEVDVDALEREKPKEPDPPPEPDPVEPKAIRTPRAPEPMAPAAAQAGQALTAEPSPDDPLDFTNTIVTGPGTSYAGGVTAANGTSKTAVTDRRAKGGVPPGGTGTGKVPAPPPPPPPEKSRARSPAPESLNWNCGFPAEADMEQIDFATVMLSVTVGPDGRAKSVSVLKDPGNGFGNLAKSCAFRMRYNVGLDAEGKAVTKTTPPFPVRFTR